MEVLKKKGFTLIELLVVVSIIGLLASVVLASLNSTRSKAKDAAVKQEISQFEKLFALEYSNTGSYCGLIPIALWINGTAGKTCADVPFIGAYASNARQICNSIFNNASSSYGEGRFLVGVGSGTCSTAYALTVALNNGKMYCSGISGKGEYSGYNYWDVASVGCYYHP